MLILSLTTFAVFVVSGIIQRITGMGFGLVSAPILVLMFGPIDGVLLTVVASLLISLTMVVQQWKLIEFRRLVPILISGAIAVPIGAWVTWNVSHQALLFIVGGAALFSLVAPYIPGFGGVMTGRRGPWIAGGASGFLHVTSSLSGPPLVAYGGSVKWAVLPFIASIQIVFLFFNGATLALRGLPDLDPILFVPAIGGTLIGYVIGLLFSRLIPVRIIRVLMYVIAWAGVLTVLGKGALSLI